MSTTARKRKADPELEAAVEYFAARSHDAWRRAFLKANPGEKGKPRMRLRGGVMVDVNQPWSKLHAKAQADNKRAARDAYRAVMRFPDDREAAANFVHECWMKRNAKDSSQPKALFKSYSRLPAIEKDKDRAHVDAMKKALAAVRKGKPAPKPRGPARIEIDPAQWRRLETAAKQLSRTLGRDVPAEALASAGIDAMISLCKSLDAKPRGKRR